MNLFARALRPLQAIMQARAGLPSQPRRSSPGGVPRNRRFRPRLEALEERTVPSVFSHIVSVQIVAQHTNLRLAPGTPLELVVAVTGEDHNGHPLTVIGTAQQLAVQDGVAVDFHLLPGSRNRGVIVNDFDFLVNGLVTVRKGQTGFGVGIVASAGAPDLNEPPVTSPRFQLVRDNRISNRHAFDGSYTGTFGGTFQDAQNHAKGSVSGPVQFQVFGLTVVVNQPGMGAGSISPNGTEEFAFGNGGLTIQGIPGSAQFTGGLTRLSDLRVFGGGGWSFQGTNPRDGTAVTASGVWSIQ